MRRKSQSIDVTLPSVRALVLALASYKQARGVDVDVVPTFRADTTNMFY